MKEFIKKYKKWIAGLLAVAGVSAGVANFGAVSNTENYQIISNVRGYITKPDPTNISADYLVAGSQNVIINDQERIESRSGYALYGQASTTAQAITSDYVWRNSGATSTIPSEIFLRSSANILQYKASSTWENLWEQVSTTTPIRFASVWNKAEQIDILLFVNSSSTLFEWSGGQATFTSSTATTIGINEAVGESRFFISGTRKLRIKDTSGIWRSFAYTGQQTSTFSGISPDPTSFTFNSSSLVVQEIRPNVNTPALNFVSDTIKILNNQVWVGSQNSRNVYVSKNTSYTDYTFSAPRVAGEGELLTLDDTTIGFEVADDDKMLIFSGKDRIYQVSFEISSGSTGDRELSKVRPLLVSSGQGAMSQELIAKIKQAVIWVDNNKELVELGQVENLPSTQAVSISDPIKPDFINADFTNGEIEFWRNSVFITAPPDGKIFIYDLAKKFWQPPQIIGMRRLSQYDNLLYGHNQSVPETYQLFTGLNDNNNPMAAKAHFAYINGGKRDALKNFNRYFTELYLASNTKLNVSILYDWLGAKGITTYELDGADQTFLFNPTVDASLGVNPLGTNPLGGLTSVGENLPKYRRLKPLVPKDFFEYQVRFESEDIDYAWQILANGSNLSLSQNSPTTITK